MVQRADLCREAGGPRGDNDKLLHTANRGPTDYSGLPQYPFSKHDMAGLCCASAETLRGPPSRQPDGAIARGPTRATLFRARRWLVRVLALCIMIAELQAYLSAHGAPTSSRAVCLRRSRTNPVRVVASSLRLPRRGYRGARTVVGNQLVKLLNGRSAGDVAKSMRLIIKTHGLDAVAATPVEKAAGYLVKHTRLLNYSRARADGLPIATGVIEGRAGIW